MSTSLTRRWRHLVAGTAAAALAAGTLAFAAAPASAAPVQVDDATFTWGLSNEAGGGAYFGGCNFLAAGEAGNTGSSRQWTEADGFYKTTDGNVSIVKPGAGGTDVEPTWATKCLDADGTPVSASSASSTTGNKVVISDGEGAIDSAAGTATIQWDGSFTVAFYGGMTYWSASDPKLTVAADGTGTVTATASGYGTTMDDMSQWTAIDPQQITLATLTDVEVTASGIDVTPDYLGVEVDLPAGSTPQARTGASWGSFPQSFVDFQQLTGQTSYWYSSGSGRDAAKPVAPIAVDYTTPEPIGPAKVSVSKTTLPTTGSTTVTIDGSGFDPAAGANGFYAVFGRLADKWKPSEGIPQNDASKFAKAAWVRPNQIASDGSWSTTLDVSKAEADAIADDGNYGIYTFGAHGVTVAAYETFTPITFADPAPPAVASSTTLSAPTKLAYGRSRTVTATVRSSKAVSGKVTLKAGSRSLGTRTVSRGRATFALPKNLKVGRHALTATFASSNTSVVKSSTTRRTLVVTKVATRTKVKVKKPTRTKKGKATVRVTGSPKAKGKVTIVVKAKGVKKTIRKKVRNGKVSVVLPKAKRKGTYKVTVRFGATSTHKASKKVVKVKVKR